MFAWPAARDPHAAAAMILMILNDDYDDDYDDDDYDDDYDDDDYDDDDYDDDVDDNDGKILIMH